MVDANILFSALIRDSATRRIIMESGKEFLLPVLLFTELGQHFQEVLRKSDIDVVDFFTLLGSLIEKMEIVPDEVLLQWKWKAWDIVKHIDPDDVAYIACCLAHPGSILWSDDKALKRQKRIRILNTEEMTALLESR